MCHIATVYLKTIVKIPEIKTNDGYIYYISSSLKIEPKMGTCHHFCNCIDDLSRSSNAREYNILLGVSKIFLTFDEILKNNDEMSWLMERSPCPKDFQIILMARTLQIG